MKIVLATKSVPFPLTNGSAIRNYQFLRWLSLTHEVTLISFVRSDEQLHGAEALKPFCKAIELIDERRTAWRQVRDLARSTLGGKPYTVCAHSSAQFAKLLAKHAAGADIVQMAELYLAENTPVSSTPVVLDAHNVETTILTRMASVERRRVKRAFYAIQAKRMARYEQSVIKNFAGVVVLSPAELEWFKERHPLVAYAPNGVERRAEPGARRDGGPKLLFVGTLEYPPNRDAVELLITEVLPLIQKAVPDVTVDIVGTKPLWTERYARAPGVRFLGRVEDLASLFAEAAAMVVPLRAGGGTRLKILDAFTAGVPVVSSTIGAEGLGVTDGEQLLLRDTPAAFAEAVCLLLHDRELGDRMAYRAFKWSQDSLSWQSIVASVEPLYDQLLSRSPVGQRSNWQ